MVNENQIYPTNEKLIEAYNINNELETSMIFHAFSYEVLLTISSSNSAKEAYDKLKKIYLNTKFFRGSSSFKKICNHIKRKMKLLQYT